MKAKSYGIDLTGLIAVDSQTLLRTRKHQLIYYPKLVPSYKTPKLDRNFCQENPFYILKIKHYQEQSHNNPKSIFKFLEQKNEYNLFQFIKFVAEQHPI
jgi:hypothetical protein